jgi:integrase
VETAVWTVAKPTTFVEYSRLSNRNGPDVPVSVLNSSPIVPAALSSSLCTRPSGLPRFWAAIWSDVFKGSIEPSTRRGHLAALERLYEAVRRQRGADCLDRLLAEADGDTLEDCLVGFLAQLRNEAAVDGFDRAPTWSTSVSFVTDVLRLAGPASGKRASEIQAKLLRLETLYRQLRPNPKAPPPPIRALPPSVIEDLYEIFNPDSPRNPFKTKTQRWRNLLIFMLLLRLGLRRGESALLLTNSFKEDFDPSTGKTVTWLDVQQTGDDDPRYEEPSLKTANSRRQLPVQQELLHLAKYVRTLRGAVNYPHLLISQKSRPLSLRSISEVFETATVSLSRNARKSLEKQGLSTVSCHDLRHTCAVVRMRRYQDAGNDVDRAQEKLRLFFGWSPESHMPRLYARAYFETSLDEVWSEKFDTFVDALRRASPEAHL